METSTLDGEKNLKPRESIKKENFCRATVTVEDNNIEAEVDIHMKISIKHPSYILYEFDGHITYYDEKDQLQSTPLVGIDSKNLLLKGAKVKNTKWVVGIVMYTGAETKIQMNATTAKSKMSAMERKLHKIVLSIFAAQLTISVFAGFGRPLLLLMSPEFNYNHFIKFVTQHSNEKYTEHDSAVQNLMDGFRYFLLLNSLIPISLVVSLEVVRLLQSVLTGLNYELHCHDRNIPCKVNTSTVNEELGQIEYLLSDKTGTLTQNKMVLQGVFIGDQVFGGEFKTSEGKVQYESFGDKQKRNKKRILTELDEQFDHSMHNIMHTKTGVRLRKPLVISNQKMQKISYISSNKECSSKGAKTFNLVLQKNPVGSKNKEYILESPLNFEARSDSLRPQTPRDGIFSNSPTPMPKANLQFFSNSPEKEHSENMTKYISGPKLPFLEPPVPPKMEKTTSDKQTELDTKKSKLFYLSQSSRSVNLKYPQFPKRVVTKDKEPALPSLKSIDETSQLSENDLSLLSHNKVIDRKKDIEGECVFLSTYQELISEFFLCASICHQCIIDLHLGDRSYQGPSPDEIAICKGSKIAGCQFMGTSSDGISELDIFGKTRKLNMMMVDSLSFRNSLLIQIGSVIQ